MPSVSRSVRRDLGIVPPMKFYPQRLALFMAHRSELVNYANRIVRDQAHAEDVVQEAYLRFDTVADRHQPDEPVGYLYRIVRNLALDGWRRLQREDRHLVKGEDGKTDQIGDGKPSAETVMEGRAEVAVLMKAMAELPERTRMALEMYRFEEVPLREIALRLGISIGLAHRLVADGLEHCRQRLYASGRRERGD